MAGTGTAHLRDADDILLRVEDLVVEHPHGRGRVVHAVSGISFDLRHGETLGIVGESGCGKSTTARALVQLPPPTSGRVLLDGDDLVELPAAEVRAARRRMQLVFQDPVASLNPRRRVGDIVAEPLHIWREGSEDERRVRVDEALAAVGLDPESARGKRPHQFSGGQCQRISIARALVLEPRLLICDEPVSALDVSVQAQILNLLADMRDRYGLSLVFIAHDLAVVRHISDLVAVMYLGKLCEVGPPEQLYERPAHPYTQALLSAIPGRAQPAGNGVRAHLAGEPPSPVDPPSGCRFRTRCPRASDRCAAEEPTLRPVPVPPAEPGASGGHLVACHHPLTDAAPSEALAATPT